MSDEAASVCCFCFEEVPRRQRVDLAIVLNPDSDELQGLACHRRCLVDRIDSRVPLHPNLEVEGR